ncbi:M2 family metallopeptidase [Lysobacter fragariae]
MNQRHALLALAVAASLLTLSACKKEQATAPAPSVSQAPAGETADEFVKRINDEYRKIWPEMNAAQWVSSTYINDDTQLLTAKANERNLTLLNSWIEQSRKFEGQKMSPETARAIKLLKLSVTLPPPNDPKKLEELTQLATKLEGMYGSGEYCTGEGEARKCRQLGDLEDVLRNEKGDRTYEEMLDAWQGWHTISQPMRKEYERFVELSNTGAKDLGFADTGELWRSGYDMTPAEIAAETDRLWLQVKPLYEQLHCYTRTKLESKYGDKGEVAGGMLPAHLMGNMWQQDWGNLWPILRPYSDEQAGSLDITSTLEKMRDAKESADMSAFKGDPTPDQRVDIERAADLDVAKKMAARAEDFYVSLGMPKLPPSYWEKSQFIKPRDRDVVCHASAWDLNMAGDVRTKMCIKANEEDFTTLYHELGHLYYDLAYNKQPPIFQNAAHDGFHEAIGDTIVLAVTPQYLHSIGLVGEQKVSQESVINAQMRMALAKVSFLPFGLMIDRWRWGVFDGSIKPTEYNKAWWDLKAKYQGVAPVTARGEEFFDAGAKYHVPGNTPYTRYFLSHILQFQFYKALCDASGYKGPLHECSFYGNKAAGQLYWQMLGRGASQEWQKTLKEMTGSDKMDASAVLEYFSPLQAWLKQQNEGKTCGWNAEGATAAKADAKPAAKAG